MLIWDPILKVWDNFEIWKLFSWLIPPSGFLKIFLVRKLTIQLSINIDKIIFMLKQVLVVRFINYEKLPLKIEFHHYDNTVVYI